MSIAHQSAMPAVAPRARRPQPLVTAPPRRPRRTLAKIAALIIGTAFGGAMVAGAVAIALVMLVSRVGG
jgi:hypothetical protein